MRFSSGFVKVAFDGDYDHGDEYGIIANRAMGPGHKLHKTLRSAMKDPKLKVEIGYHDGSKRYRQTSDPAEIEARLDHLKKTYKSDLAWERGDHWSIGAAKADFERPGEDSTGLIRDHIYGKHIHKHVSRKGSK